MVTVTSLEHRSLFNRALGSRPFRDTGLFERIGGQPAIGRLVDLLYEGIAGDDQLRPGPAHTRATPVRTGVTQPPG